MDVTSHVTLSRQQGLSRELDTIANNIANMATSGYRREGIVFSEHVRGSEDGPSVSFGHARARFQDDLPGQLTPTGGALDLAVRGEGYFQLETGNGRYLTRAGAFMLDATGQVVSPSGGRLLDEAGIAVVVPPGAGDIHIANDGTLTAGGEPFARIGLYAPAPGAEFIRTDGVAFQSDQPFIAVPDGEVAQGFVEGSNVSPVWEMTRMIEVQRAYEFNQSLLDREDDRIRNVIRTLGQATS
ncbi:flagellar hook-basal body complex protein [Pontivivens insulae]|uniref:Flagellar basal-body rod protein FlgG n=1 Tax=Pontivivens insulae TaxID=1639689 RepID=A0A2R8A9V9_9RHOB|nr:flagellar hook-basal body complex protein [Pontivivens insulae]RED12769.1 flagellar basal-body rod protein FlgF [Pontivivens insulae]SPF28860.1 Flagellar basal-body rod protein FlgG [Pontivivens insulae]